MKRIITILLIVLPFSIFGQQDALYSQYAYNQFSLNPAYAGSRNSYSGVVMHRSQWVGIKDAPTIESFTFHSPLSKKSLAYGINVSSEKIGPFRNTAAALSIAYHLKFKRSKLSFAIRGGIYHAIFNKDLLTFKQSTDVFNIGGVESDLIPNFDFGTYYYKKNFFIGMSITHLTGDKLAFDSYPSANSLFLDPHVYIHSGIVLKTKGKLKIKPTVLVKLIEKSLPNIDLGVNFLFYEKFWLGLSVRNTSSINFLSEWNINDFFRVGYAYDYSINKLVDYNSGSHELFLGFDFVTKNRNKQISPRYL